MTFLRFLYAALFLFFLIPRCFSQITDDFSDGDFTQNPTWQGDAANFIVNAGAELQLNAPAAGSSQLAVQGNVPDSAIWSFRFRLGFAPSNQNLLRIYLLADQADLQAANGYFLEIGETGSLDALRLFRQDAGAKTLIATGQPGLVATNPDIQLRAKRTLTGTWEVEAASGAGALQAQFSVADATYGGASDRFFGFQCVYTVSNIGKFFFDDVSILPDVPDTQPPVLLAANAGDATTVEVLFNENLDSLSAVNPANYSISGGVGQPFSAALLADKRSVSLILQTPLATGDYTLQTSGVKDVPGNASGLQSVDFQFVKVEVPTVFDVLITEIMADPSPSVGLPELEWLELLNRSAKTLDLAMLRIQDETGAPVVLPSYPLLPGEYIVLTANVNVATLQAATGGTVLGAAIGVSALNNEDDVLTISDFDGNIIDRVAYSADWHTDASKDDGGWSLERINPDLPCLGRDNWQSCPVLPGGTPGAQNASFSTAPDTKPPRLLWAFPESASSVLLTFSEGLDKTSAQNPAVYRIEPPRGIASAQQLPDISLVRLLLDEPLEMSVFYTVTAELNLTDCSGNAVPATDSAFVGLPEQPEPQDIVVNEIMFNPSTGNARYIEFYNRSDKFFNWAEFFLANLSDDTSVAKIALNRLSVPGRYDVVTTHPFNILNTFSGVRFGNILKNDLPSLDDDEGNITLYWSKSGTTVILDEFDYSEDFHNALFSDSKREGVALERIDPDGFTNSPANWTSASPIVTGKPGTPTLPNSQRLYPPPPADELIRLTTERLSPDDDGFEDFLDIRYDLPQSGFAATVTVFDSDGIPVKRLVRQELIGTEGALRWDGDMDDGSRAKPGIYVLFLELYGPSGETKRIKKAFALVGKF